MISSESLTLAEISVTVGQLVPEGRIPKPDLLLKKDMHDPMHMKVGYYDSDRAAQIEEVFRHEEGLTLFKVSEEDVPKKADD